MSSARFLSTVLGRSSTAALSPGEAGEDQTAVRAWANSPVNVEGIGALVGLAVAWQIASHYFPAFLFPPLQTIAATLVSTVSDPAMLSTIGLTFLRIVVSLAGTFILASALGVAAALHPRTDRILEPLIQLKQGVRWIIFSILWFKGMEARIAFIVVISTLPSFYYQVRDGVRGISLELWQMVRAWRPTRFQMLLKLILPALRPTLLTAWRINLGGGTRMVITAELLAGVSGIGYQLRTAEEQFRMDSAVAWTVILVAFVLACDAILKAVERRLRLGAPAPGIAA